MSKKYFVGCRVDQHLFNKISNHVEQNSTLVRKAIDQYFKSVEPNKNISFELVSVLNNQVKDLQHDKEYLQQRLDYFMLPWYKRVFLLPSRKE